MSDALLVFWMIAVGVLVYIDYHPEISYDMISRFRKVVK